MTDHAQTDEELIAVMSDSGECAHSYRVDAAARIRELLAENAGLRAAVAQHEAEVARLTGKMCLICGRREPCELTDACTFDPHPIDAAKAFLERSRKAEADRDRWKARAEAAENGLTFSALRIANVARLSHFKNRHGALAHSHPTGSDWSPAQWLQAVVGELGEYANLRKKVERGDYTIEEALPELANELADVVIYLDLLAFRLNIDLGDATVRKWNKKSEDIGYPVRIDAALAAKEPRP